MDKRTQKTMMESWIKKKEATKSKTSTPEYWIKQLENESKNPEKANQALLEFIPAVKEADSAFVTTFCLNGGLKALINFTKYTTHAKQLRKSFLEIIKALLNAPNDIGFIMLTDHSHVIQVIVDTFDTNDEPIKTRCLQILCFLCWWKNDSYDKVVACMFVIFLICSILYFVCTRVNICLHFLSTFHCFFNHFWRNLLSF